MPPGAGDGSPADSAHPTDSLAATAELAETRSLAGTAEAEEATADMSRRGSPHSSTALLQRLPSDDSEYGSDYEDDAVAAALAGLARAAGLSRPVPPRRATAFLSSLLPDSVRGALRRFRHALHRVPPASIGLLFALVAFDVGSIVLFVVFFFYFLPRSWFLFAASLVLLIGGLIALNIVWLTRRSLPGELGSVAPSPIGRYDVLHSGNDGIESDDEVPPAYPPFEDRVPPNPGPGTLIGKWMLGTKLGEGKFATVHVATSISGISAACKSIPTPTPRSALFAWREAACLLEIDNSHVPKLLDVIESPEAIHLFISRAAGIELFDHCENQPDGHLTESECREIAIQLLRCLAVLHAQGILHRDVKLDNLLYDPATKRLTLIDFGLATPCSGYIAEPTGAVAYSSPDVLALRVESDPYSFANGHPDIWSAGVCIYAILVGRFPFKSDEGRPDQLLAALRAGSGINLDKVGLSDPAADFLQTVLDPVKTPTAKGLLTHPWLDFRGQVPDPRIAKGEWTSSNWRAQLDACRAIVAEKLG